ncbi:MAG: caspase family protein [Bacteroidetes bacterium]|nr:caspase family protein [Bacteroidota bacterium]
MRRCIFSFVGLIVFGLHGGQAQSTFEGDSPPASFAIANDNVPVNKTPPAIYIKKYVEKNIIEWQKKGEFEKTSDYQNRVNEKARNAKAQELTNQAVDALKRDYAAGITWSELQLSQYDADHETYLIKSTQLGDFALPVSLVDAQSFKQGWNSMKFQNTDFYIKNNKLVLAKLTFSNPADGKNYVYDSQQPTTYAANNITYNFAPIEIDVPKDSRQTYNTKIENKSMVVGKSDVDVNIPKSTTGKPNAYALIIGNEDYTTYQTGLSNEVNVDFAKNDAQVFAEYCKNTLGIPAKQVKLLINATGSQMRQGLAWINNLAGIENGNAELIFYYSGHGLPDEVTKDPYLIPVDVSGTQIQYAIKLEEAYVALTAKPSKQITVFLDACFSGGARNQSLIAMKSVKVKPNNTVDLNNIVVFASSSGDESSAVYKEKQHGYFTYFLLKKLQETKGEVDYKTLSNYLIQNVTKETGLISKKQTPQVMVDPQMQVKWTNLRIK